MPIGPGKGLSFAANGPEKGLVIIVNGPEVLVLSQGSPFLHSDHGKGVALLQFVLKRGLLLSIGPKKGYLLCRWS